MTAYLRRSKANRRQGWQPAMLFRTRLVRDERVAVWSTEGSV